MKRTIVAEDEFITAEYFRAILLENKFEILSVSHSGEEAVQMSLKFKPDLVFLDICMESKTAGIEACRQIKQSLPETKVYLLSAYPKEVFEKELSHISYDGYIDKTSFEYFISEHR